MVLIKHHEFFIIKKNYEILISLWAIKKTDNSLFKQHLFRNFSFDIAILVLSVTSAWNVELGVLAFFFYI